MKPMIYQRIAPPVVAPHMLLLPDTKEVVAETALSGAWVNRTLHRVSRTGVNGSTPGDMGHIVRIDPSLVLIGVFGT